MLILSRGGGFFRSALAAGRRSCEGTCAFYCIASSSNGSAVHRERATDCENAHSTAAAEQAEEGAKERSPTDDDASRRELRRHCVERRARAALLNARIERAKRNAALIRLRKLTKVGEEPVEKRDTANADEKNDALREKDSRLDGGAEKALRIPCFENSVICETSEDEDAVAKAKLKLFGVSQFRKIIYDEGELEKTDIAKPPSRKNPHPFEPSSNPDLIPPTHSRTLVPYVNHFPALQNLVLLGVDLLDVDTNTLVGRKLVKMDWERDLLPKLAWIVKLGVAPAELGSYLTRNPFFLTQDLDAMKVRVNYLRSKNFTKEQIVKIVVGYRYWLNTEVRVVDARLGWIQKNFQLSGNNVRSLLIKEPRIIMFGIGPIQRLLQMFTKELEFTVGELKSMLLKDPRLFLIEARQVLASYAYLHYTMGLSNAQLARCPLALRCTVAAIRRRHEFLVKVGRADYDVASPSRVPLESLLHPSDRYFAVNVARVFLVAYNEFLKRY